MTAYLRPPLLRPHSMIPSAIQSLRHTLLFLLMALWSTVGASVLFAQEDPVPEDDPAIAALHTRTLPFLEGVSQGKTKIALSELLQNSPLEKQTEAVDKLTARTLELDKKYGKYRGFERIVAKRIGKDLVLMKYLYKCEKFPVVWYFTYYRDFGRSDIVAGSNNWVIIAVRFDTELELLGF